jgi:hypothetical protein
LDTFILYYSGRDLNIYIFLSPFVKVPGAWQVKMIGIIWLEDMLRVELKFVLEPETNLPIDFTPAKSYGKPVGGTPRP